jgi:poly(A) polymerase
MKGVTQPIKYHPEGDVFEHTKLMLKNMAMPSLELAWAVLLHDVGKPETLEIGENGAEHFYFHADSGNATANEILQRLKFPSKFIENVCFAVKNHMRFSEVSKMRVAKYKKIIAAETFPLELELHRLDCLSSNGIVDNFVFLLDKIQEQSGERELPPPLISGQDLISLGFKQGPEMGKILRDIRERQIEGYLNSKDEALEYVNNKTRATYP